MRISLVVLIFGIFLGGISLLESNNTYTIMSSIWIVGSLILKKVEDKE